MDVLVVILTLAIAIFAASFITKRRFGLLALALTAGSILSSIWGYEVGLMAGAFGVPRTSFSTAVILMLITILPSVVLLFHGYTYKSFVGRTVGAVLFTVLTLAFLVEPLGHILVAQGMGAVVYNWLIVSKNAIIGVGLILAVVDLFFTKPALTTEKRAKH